MSIYLFRAAKEKPSTKPEIQTLMERYLSGDKPPSQPANQLASQTTTQQLINQYATQHGVDDIVTKFAKAAGKRKISDNL